MDPSLRKRRTSNIQSEPRLSLRQTFDELINRGIEIIDFEAWTTSDGQQTRYAGVFREGSDANHHLLVRVGNREEFGFLRPQLSMEGYVLIDYEEYFELDGNGNWAGIFREGSEANRLLNYEIDVITSFLLWSNGLMLLITG